MRRDPTIGGAAALTALAFAGSYSHTQSVVAEHGQDGWISFATAAMPEAAVLLVVLRRVQDGRLDLSGWVVGATAAAFTISANLATAEPSVWGWVVAGWPAWAAIGATILAHGAASKPCPVDVADIPAPTPTPATDPTPASDVAAQEHRTHVTAPVPVPAVGRRSKTPAQAWDELDKAIADRLVVEGPGVRPHEIGNPPTADDIRLAIRISLTRSRWLRERIRDGLGRPADDQGWPT